MPRKVKGYSRVDSGDAHGWLVRIKRGDLRRSRFISDSTHGGKAKARKIAEQVFQDWTSELPDPETAEGKLGKRNSSGFVGVHYTHDVDARYPNCAYEYYIASWKGDDGVRHNVRFAISKWGKRKAFELACIARQKRNSDRAAVERLHSSGYRVNKSTKKSKAVKKGAKKVPKKSVKKKASQRGSAKKAVTVAKKKKAKVSRKKVPASKKTATKPKASKKKAKTSRRKAARKK